jgi:hypothetical protein
VELSGQVSPIATIGRAGGYAYTNSDLTAPMMAPTITESRISDTCSLLPRHNGLPAFNVTFDLYAVSYTLQTLFGRQYVSTPSSCDVVSTIAVRDDKTIEFYTR